MNAETTMEEPLTGTEKVETKESSSSGKASYTRNVNPFWVIVRKEISDHVTSWRFNILVILLALTCLGSLYTAITSIGTGAKANEPDDAFLFLKLFTVTDGTLPSFTVFISILGPLLGIALGFDAINSEHNRGTLSRLMAQPIHRDYVINAKALAALFVISVMFFALCFLVMGIGIIRTGIPPTPEEFLRIVCFILISICYVAFWLNLSIFFSVRFRQPATAALCGISVWIFFTVFYGMIVNVIAKVSAPTLMASESEVIRYKQFIQNLLRLVPSQLFSDATTTLLMPSVRSLGPLTMEQVIGAVPSPLPLGQSLLLVWPQVTGLVAATLLCFALSYVSFMRREIRPR
jgi:ABC-2 type transport system permease protein